MTTDLEQLRADLEAATDGPWIGLEPTSNRVILQGGTVYKIWAKSNDMTPIVFISGLDDEDINEGEANARLIVRAPDMAQTILDQAAEIERLRGALGSAAEVVEKLPYPDWSRRESKPLARGFNWCKREASKAIRAALQENSDD